MARRLVRYNKEVARKREWFKSYKPTFEEIAEGDLNNGFTLGDLVRFQAEDGMSDTESLEYFDSKSIDLDFDLDFEPASEEFDLPP